MMTHLRMSFKVQQAFEILLFMQQRLKCRNQTRLAKLEILENSWNKFLGNLFENNKVVKNSKIQEIVIKIGQIPADIRRAALDEFLRCS